MRDLDCLTKNLRAFRDWHPYHSRTAPIILTARGEVDLWMTLPTEDRLGLSVHCLVMQKPRGKPRNGSRK
jgi:hypothetical protein